MLFIFFNNINFYENTSNFSILLNFSFACKFWDNPIVIVTGYSPTSLIRDT